MSPQKFAITICAGVKKCWAEMEPELLKKLCASMKTRMQFPALFLMNLIHHTSHAHTFALSSAGTKS